jgi:hypothetical protein
MVRPRTETVIRLHTRFEGKRYRIAKNPAVGSRVPTESFWISHSIKSPVAIIDNKKNSPSMREAS